MSKEERFIYFGIDVLEGSDEFNLIAEEKKKLDENSARICRAIREIKRELKQQENNADISEKVYKSGRLKIKICDENQRETPAQIKLFPLLAGESASNYQLINQTINMIREITNNRGICELELPIGTYYAEITKGSEYEILKDEIVISEDMDTIREYQLVKFFDLKELHYFAGDLHHHSIFSSPVYGGTDDVIEKPELVCNSMRAMGLSFGALSDHHNILNHEDWKKVEKDDFVPLISKEISTSNGHVMSLGVNTDVIYRIPEDANRTDEYLRAEFVRITDEIKEAGGLAQINHPRDRSTSNSLNPEFYDMIGIFDTMEIWNGATPMLHGTGNYQTFELWRELLEQNRYIPVTTGSDTHNIKANDYHKIFQDMVWMKEKLLELDAESELRKKYQIEIDKYLSISEKMFPILEKWAETTLTSGCIRTYIKLENKPESSEILASLKRGNSFLTSGPILVPTLNGVGPGETLCVTAGEKVLMNLQIMSNRKLDKITMYADGKRCIVKNLIELDKTKSCNFYDYSFQEELPFADAKWIFFVVEEDCTNMAISNPIFLKR